ncbi:MAG: hypothetical protein D6744_00210 [Planctomycetota bacterium]|nr:MAG: hypothetical protein D6744_00210 [Planctomycetota bacterium]
MPLREEAWRMAKVASRDLQKEAAWRDRLSRPAEKASRKWTAISGATLLPEVVTGVRFVAGEKPETTAA